MNKKHDDQKQSSLANFPLFKDERAQKFTTLVLTLIALSVFGLFAINPTVSTIAELRKKIDDSQYVLDQLTAKVEALNTLNQKYQEIQPDLPYVDSAIPTSPNVPKLVGQVQHVANNAGLSIENIQAFQVDLAAGSNSQKHGSFAFSISANGTDDQVNTFLSQFVHFNRLVTIESLSAVRNISDQNQVSLTLRGNAYFLK